MSGRKEGVEGGREVDSQVELREDRV